MRYDVFVSKNTKDINMANAIVEYLIENGLSVFESNKDIPTLSNADYAMAIDKAIEASDNMIVICSENDNASGEDENSSWVYYEWTTFRNELLSKRKNGNLISVTSIDVNQLPIGLRKYQYFNYCDIRNTDLIQFIKKKDPLSGQPKAPSALIELPKINAKELQAFDYGYHFSLYMFAKMQGKQADTMDLLYEDVSNIHGESYKIEYWLNMSPDEIEHIIELKYSNDIASLFSFGQRVGLATTYLLFIVNGLEIASEHANALIDPFISDAKRLCIPQRIIDEFISFSRNISPDSEIRIVKYYYIIRHAIAQRYINSTDCPFCGTKIATDYTKCPKCLSPLHSNK